MKNYEITIRTILLEDESMIDAENQFLQLMEEGYLEYEITEIPVKEEN